MFGSLATWRRWWWLALVIVFASACQADLEVLVTVNEDGSGTVSTITTIDAETASQLLDLDLDAAGLVLADLAQAGWVVGPPEQNSAGSTVITAAKDFGTAAQFAEVMNELTGPDGAIRDFRLTRSKSFARVEYRIAGTIDTTVDLESFSDNELEAVLGRSLSEIGDRYEAAEEQVNFRLEIVLPGDLQGEEPTGIVDSEPDLLRAVWEASLDDDAVLPIALSSATRQVSSLVLRGVAVVAGILAGLVVFAQILRFLLPDRRRRPERKRGGPAPGRAAPTPSATETEAESETVAEVSAANPYRVVALDAMGVLYREADDVSRLLIPFVRERSTASMTDDEIRAKARALTLGRMTTGQFWVSVGVGGEAAELDAAYLLQHQLTPGVIKYLRSLRENKVQAACITNDALRWALALKANHNLEGLIDPWVVSGSVGVRKPAKPIFEVLRRVTGHAPSAILVIDDNLDILDAARDLGYGTAWFAPDGLRADARDHSLIRNFQITNDDLVESEIGARTSGPD